MLVIYKKECALAHSGVSRGRLRHVSASCECASSRSVLYVTVHAYVPSNGICRGFAFKYGKFLLPPRFLTALSVPKVPTREQLRLYNARKKCKANKFASSRQMWYITYSDEICLFLEKRRENKTYEENKI